MIDFHPQHCGTLHFVGIGGIGMSGIAEALVSLGYTVQGSDAAQNYNTKRLEQHGVKIFMGHDAAHLQTTNDSPLTAIVVSSAIKPDNPELVAARAQKIPVVRRADMLAEIMRHKKCISVAGTHGKTTTTSLVGTMLEGAHYDPTIINGGIIQSHGTNTRMGKGEWMVVESDESDGSFNRLPTTIAVVTNIDPEHLEHYGSFDGVRRAFRDFVQNIPFYGFAVMCIDHPEVRKIAGTITDRRIYTYAIDNADADVRASNIQTSANGITFDVTFGPHITGGASETVTGIALPMMGMHNVLNSLVPLTIARAFKIDADTMKTALAGFQGVKRRFTKTGEVNGITVIDDYGHHPVEIQATLRAARQAVTHTGGKVIAVMQPHRYTRLKSLFPEFCAAFDDADHVIIADVYAAGETPIDGISRDALVSGIMHHGHKSVVALQTMNDAALIPAELARLINLRAHSGDFIICLGAGSITNWAYALPDALTHGANQQARVEPARSMGG